MKDMNVKLLEEEVRALSERATDLKEELAYVNQTLKDKQAEYEIAKNKADGMLYYKILAFNGPRFAWSRKAPYQTPDDCTSFEVDYDTHEIVRVININKNFNPTIEEKIKLCKAKSKGVCKETAATLHRWREEIEYLKQLLED